MSKSDWTLQSNGLPPDTASLLELLDRHYPPATVRTASELADPQSLYDLAFRAGKRAVVDDLKLFRQRQQERHRENA